MMSEELRLRIMSALVLAAVVLSVTYFGGIWFQLLAALIGLLIFYEWSTIIGSVANDRAGAMSAWSGMAVTAAATVFSSLETALVLLAAFFIVLSGRSLLRKTSLWLPGGVLYAGLSMVSLAALRGSDQTGFVAVLFLFAVVWGTDILAYFVGRAIGGPKLAPRISPGKTWSGAFGGTVSGAIAGLLLLFFMGQPISLWVILAAVLLSVASQIGDLFESFIKRRFGVKDSSRLIPGHGGVMDRVDGLVFACFAAFLTCSAAMYALDGTLGQFSHALLGLN